MVVVDEARRAMFVARVAETRGDAARAGIAWARAVAYDPAVGVWRDLDEPVWDIVRCGDLADEACDAP